MKRKLIQAIQIIVTALIIMVITLAAIKYTDKQWITEQEINREHSERMLEAAYGPATIKIVKTTSVESAEPTPTYESVGTYLITYYCSCEQCCGKSDGITASGVKATSNHTIAADTSIYSFGTVLLINGTEYTVEDRGGAINGNRIDIYCDSHQEALEKGLDNYEVFVKG